MKPTPEKSVEEVRDRIYYEHLEDILMHAELKVHASDEKQHNDDQRERIHKMLEFITQTLQAERQKREEIRKETWAIGYAQCEVDNNLMPTVNVDYEALTQPQITNHDKNT